MAHGPTHTTVMPGRESPTTNIYIHEKRCKKAFSRIAAPAQHVFMMIVEETAARPNLPITCEEMLAGMGYHRPAEGFLLWIENSDRGRLFGAV